MVRKLTENHYSSSVIFGLYILYLSLLLLCFPNLYSLFLFCKLLINYQKVDDRKGFCKSSWLQSKMYLE